jgi:Putative amidoligase enzyme
VNERTFGVEVECGHPRGTSGVRELLRDHGLNWQVGSDGSGVEARTPILSGKEGFKEFRKGMRIIRETGGYVTNADGLHVHHGAPELRRNKELAVVLVKSWVNNQEHIGRLAATRRRSGYPCPSWTPAQVALLETATDNPADYPLRDSWDNRIIQAGYFAHCGPRGALNLHSLVEHGTIEIRLLEGTLDVEKAETWIRFGQRFINDVLGRKRPLPACGDTEELLRKVRAGQKTRRLLTQERDATYHNFNNRGF